jgi:catechol 2,3-dioxygenase-like lactoylglutathione lyase family enzyme
MLLRTAHFSFTVEDLDRSLSFYRDTLGMRLIGSMEREGSDISSIVSYPGAHLKIAMLELPGGTGTLLELIEYVAPRGRAIDRNTCNPGSAHICFLVEDMDSAHSRLRAGGVRFKSDPVQVVAGMNRGGFAVYFTDPDGNTLELLQPPRKG